jgi:hypothetical protein
MEICSSDIDPYFYKKSDIIDSLKCAICQSLFQDPRLLPCGDAVCNDCALFEQNKESEGTFKCSKCDSIHTNIKAQNLLPVKALDKISKAKPLQIYQGTIVEQLKKNLEKISKNLDLFEKKLKNPEYFIANYCSSLRNQVDLANQVDKLNFNSIYNEYSRTIDSYEAECLQCLQENKRKMNEEFGCVEVYFSNEIDFIQMRCKEIEKGSNISYEPVRESEIHLERILKNSEKLDYYLYKPGKMSFKTLNENNSNTNEENKAQNKYYFKISLSHFSVANQSFAITNYGTVLYHAFLSENNILKIKYGYEFLYFCLFNIQGNLKKEVKYTNNQSHGHWAQTIQCSEDAFTVAFLEELNENLTIKMLVFDYDLIELRSKLIDFENISELRSIDSDNSRYYILVYHVLESLKWCSLTVYSKDFDLIQVKGDSRDTKNPFYFDASTEIVKVKHEKLYILRAGVITIKDENTGYTISQISNCSLNFQPSDNSDLLVFDNKNKVIVKSLYDRLKFQIEIPHNENFEKSQFLNGSLIYFSSQSYLKTYYRSNDLKIIKYDCLPKFLFTRTKPRQELEEGTNKSED